MTKITHDQARRYLLAAADNLLGDAERTALNQHLRACEECRAEARQLNALHNDLRSTFRAHWDALSVPEKPLVTEPLTPEPLWPRLGRLAAIVSLTILWVWLYRAVFGYLRVIFSHEEFRTNQVVLLIVLVLIAVQFRQERLHFKLDSLPHFYAPSLVLILGGSVAYLLVERFLDINTLSATLFALATYGLLGLWMSPHRWREGLPAALLLIGTLPFGMHLQTFVGYPMRIASAAIVRDGLQFFGVHSVGVDTILVFESGLAQVDLPCSGVKSLWTGMLFLTAATWLERRRIDLRWLGLAALLAGLLFVANVARVGVLVFVGQVMNWKMMTEMIHVPLGVLAFVGVCMAALFLLKWLGSESSSLHLSEEISLQHKSQVEAFRPLWLTPVLALFIAGMALLYTPRPQTAAAQSAIQWHFPADLQAESYPLSEALLDWVTKDGADSADRWHFTWQDGAKKLTGSFLFLTSNTWRGQHRPERCFEVEGLTVESSQTVMLAGDFSARFLRLSGGPKQVSAVYWLQTGNQVTDDYAQRIWADLSPERPSWVLVTVLFDDLHRPDDQLVQAVLQALRVSVASSMDGGQP